MEVIVKISLHCTMATSSPVQPRTTSKSGQSEGGAASIKLGTSPPEPKVNAMRPDLRAIHELRTLCATPGCTHTSTETPFHISIYCKLCTRRLDAATERKGNMSIGPTVSQ